MEKAALREEFLKLLGNVPWDKDPFTARFRLHQGWWRAAVLLENEGPHPVKPTQTVCNTFTLRQENQAGNYLTQEAMDAVHDEITRRKRDACSGLIQEPRIWNNLLSSQPLAFNFWGPLKYNPDLANRLLRFWIPGFSELSDIRFEWSPQPKEDFINDNSAFDVMVEYRDKNGVKSMLGLECKYTDKLNGHKYDSERYREVFGVSQAAFKNDYAFYLQPQFNQLFRNQLMAASIARRWGTACRCGLFCSRQDNNALSIAREFAAHLNEEDAPFLILAYEEFIEGLQKLDVDWHIREWSMMLWARYLGLPLSRRVQGSYEETRRTNSAAR